MIKYYIFGNRVCVEKKVLGPDYINFKITINREAIFLRKERVSSLKYKWSIIEKHEFIGEDCSISNKEEKTISEFVRFKLVFEAYKHLFQTKNLMLTVSTLEIENADVCREFPFHYTKSVILQSGKVISDEMLRIHCVFDATLYKDGTNTLMSFSKVVNSYPIQMSLYASTESVVKNLGTGINVSQPIDIDAENNLIVMWFVVKILPTYYMQKFMRP